MGQLPFERIERTPFQRQKAQTNPQLGKKPQERTVEELLNYGIVNLDKPSGPTSHQVSAYVRDILGLAKTGHSGTLDPAVTGILPVALGRGTRVVQSLLTAGKEYICLMKLHAPQSREDIEEALKKFTGKIIQMPPVKSAVKRQLRKRNIYYNELLECNDTEVLFRIGCQAGTYIRKICHDIGEHLGCGAHMAELRRTKAGPFNEKNGLVTLHDLKDAYVTWKEEGDETDIRRCVKVLEEAVAHLPKIVVVDSAIDSLCCGATLKVVGVVSVEANIQVGEPVAVMSLKGELILVGDAQMISKDIATKKNGVAIKSRQVFMQPGTYKKKST